MTALLLQVFGGANAPNGSRFHVEARSREFLRRGLVLSGAVHIALLVTFLSLRGNGDDVLIRANSSPIDIFHQPTTPPLVPVPPAEIHGGATTQSKTGIIDPYDPRVLHLPPVDFHGFGQSEFHGVPGTPPGNPGSTTGGAGQPPEDPGQVFTIDKVDVPPVPIDAPKPDYPQVARDYGISGRVIALVLVEVDGSVSRVQILSGNKILADAAQDALYRWRFHAARAHGRPVRIRVEIPVNFIL